MPSSLGRRRRDSLQATHHVDTFEHGRRSTIDGVSSVVASGKRDDSSSMMSFEHGDEENVAPSPMRTRRHSIGSSNATNNNSGGFRKRLAQSPAMASRVTQKTRLDCSDSLHIEDDNTASAIGVVEEKGDLDARRLAIDLIGFYFGRYLMKRRHQLPVVRRSLRRRSSIDGHFASNSMFADVSRTSFAPRFELSIDQRQLLLFQIVFFPNVKRILSHMVSWIIRRRFLHARSLALQLQLVFYRFQCRRVVQTAALARQEELDFVVGSDVSLNIDDALVDEQLHDDDDDDDVRNSAGKELLEEQKGNGGELKSSFASLSINDGSLVSLDSLDASTDVSNISSDADVSNISSDADVSNIIGDEASAIVDPIMEETDNDIGTLNEPESIGNGEEQLTERSSPTTKKPTTPMGEMEWAQLTLRNTRLNSGYKYSDLQTKEHVVVGERPASPTGHFCKANGQRRKWSDHGSARIKTIDQWKTSIDQLQIEEEDDGFKDRSCRIKWDSDVYFLDSSDESSSCLDSNNDKVEGMLDLSKQPERPILSSNRRSAIKSCRSSEDTGSSNSSSFPRIPRETVEIKRVVYVPEEKHKKMMLQQQQQQLGKKQRKGPKGAPRRRQL